MIRYVLFVILFVFVFGSGCSLEKLQKYKDTQNVMGTQVSVTVFSRDPKEAQQAIGYAFQRMSEWEFLFSKHKEGSDIRRLNDSPLRRIKISAITFDLLSKSIEYGHLSNGAFDITVHPLWDLWKEAEKRNKLPSAQQQNKALSKLGFDKIKLHPDTSEAELTIPEMSLDLGGIAKGFIVDEAIRVLRSHGIKHGLIDAGGDICVLGKHPDRGHWLIGIRNPLNPKEKLESLKISDKAVATSGNYMRFTTIKGKTYSHVFDPQTGHPVSNNVVSVTILAPELTHADALSTSVLVMGVQKGLVLIESLPGVETLIITHQDDKLIYYPSKNFMNFLENFSLRTSSIK
ncbi:hypothetical protein BVX98_00590 [bacterium F11]|nr:hypothetical protein BVX98_00590 [bacterium F11]